jgi:hypothetical protein
MAIRVYIPVSTAEYARLYGISTRAARGRVARLGGSKIGSKWMIPVPATEYAKRKGIRVDSARKRKTAIRAATPKDASLVQQKRASSDLARRAEKWLDKMHRGKRRYNPQTVRERLVWADTPTLERILKLNHVTEDDIFNEDYYGSDGESVLFYH